MSSTASRRARYARTSRSRASRARRPAAPRPRPRSERSCTRPCRDANRSRRGVHGHAKLRQHEPLAQREDRAHRHEAIAARPLPQLEAHVTRIATRVTNHITGTHARPSLRANRRRRDKHLLHVRVVRQPVAVIDRHREAALRTRSEAHESSARGIAGNEQLGERESLVVEVDAAALVIRRSVPARRFTSEAPQRPVPVTIVGWLCIGDERKSSLVSYWVKHCKCFGNGARGACKYTHFAATAG